MFDIDRQIFDFIEKFQKGENSYKLFTTIPDFFVDADFHVINNGNYKLSFTLQPEELKKGLDLDYFFQYPFVLVFEGNRILVQNVDIINGNQGLNSDAPCNLNIEVKAFKGDTDETLWEHSKQTAYFRYDSNQFTPGKSGICFDLTTDSKDNGFYNALHLKVDNVELLFYHESVSPKSGYYIFRPNGIIDFKKFQRIIDSIISAFGFLNGYYMPDTEYYFAHKTINGKSILTYRYENSKRSFNTNAPIIDSGYYEDVPNDNLQLSSLQFNNLVNLLYKNEEYLRSALLLINAGNLKGCAKASLGAVALETITMKVGMESLNGQIIENEKLSKEIRYQLNKTLKGFSDKLDKEQFGVLSNKLNQINSKPNASKLEDAFQHLEISLDEEEKYCISCRNLFLHGNLPRRKKDMWLTDMELLDVVANRLVMLSSILLLKLANYNGMVIDRGMTEVTKWRMIRNGHKVRGGNCLRNISMTTSSNV